MNVLKKNVIISCKTKPPNLICPKMEGRERDISDNQSEAWTFTSWEKQCIEQVESQPDLEEKLPTEKEQALQRLWNAFQNAATACTQLYKERNQCNMCSCTGNLWSPFQDTANTITLLYKDGVDCYKRSLDMGCQTGYQKRNKEILAWAKKKRRHIKRDELLSYLSGRSPPRRTSDVYSTATVGSNGMSLQPLTADSVDAGVQCYGPLDSFQVRQDLVTAPFFAAAGLGTVFHSNRRRSFNESSLNDSEGREGRKRSSSSMDIVMDSPHKRNRYF